MRIRSPPALPCPALGLRIRSPRTQNGVTKLGSVFQYGKIWNQCFFWFFQKLLRSTKKHLAWHDAQGVTTPYVLRKGWYATPPLRNRRQPKFLKIPYWKCLFFFTSVPILKKSCCRKNQIFAQNHLPSQWFTHCVWWWWMGKFCLFFGVLLLFMLREYYIVQDM